MLARTTVSNIRKILKEQGKPGLKEKTMKKTLKTSKQNVGGDGNGDNGIDVGAAVHSSSSSGSSSSSSSSSRSSGGGGSNSTSNSSSSNNNNNNNASAVIPVNSANHESQTESVISIEHDMQQIHKELNDEFVTMDYDEFQA